MELPILADPDDLAESGWGVLLSQDEHPAVLHALGELLDHRREQAGNRYKELTYYPGESAKKFLWYRHGESPGIIDPEILPYYLLIVGGPDTTPFEFQYELAASRAVGRIYFEDPSDYASYAQRVVDAEKDGIELPRRAVFFLPEHDNDSATKRLAQRYFQPLAKNLSGYNSWTIDIRNKHQAYKANLRELLGGSQTPNLLVVACHGRRFPAGHPDQLARQGALICQDWTARTRPEEVHYLHAGDVTDTSNLKGLVAFLVASNSAGTPFVDDFPHETRDGMIIGTPPAPRPLAMQPFVARLPQQLLRLGALAIVGHIDRNCWG